MPSDPFAPTSSSYVPAFVALYRKRYSPPPECMSCTTAYEAEGDESDRPHAYGEGEEALGGRSTLSKTSRPMTAKGVSAPATPSWAPAPLSCECVAEREAGTHSTS